MQDAIKEKAQNFDIMLIGDSSDDLNLLVGILGENGYKVNWENSVESAFASIKTKKPDLIFLAAHMTGIDGFEVGKRLKTAPDTKMIQLFFLIDLDESNDKILVFKGSGVDFITKPYQTEDVLVRVNNYFKKKYLHQELIQSNQNLLELINKQKDIELCLKIESDRLKTVLQTIDDGIICTDSSRSITMMNEAAGNLTGRLIDEAIGKPIESVFKAINDSTRDEFENFVKKVLDTGKMLEVGSQILLVSKGGNECAVKVSAVPVFHRMTGMIDGIIVILKECSNVTNNQKKNEGSNDLKQFSGKYSRRNADIKIGKIGENKYFPFAFVIVDVKGLNQTKNLLKKKYNKRLLNKIVDILKNECQSNECRANDIVVRIGAEKFVVLMSNSDAKYADDFINRLNKSVARQSIRNVVFTLSVDFSLNSNIYDDIDAVLKNAVDELCRYNELDSLSINDKIIFNIMNVIFANNSIEKSHAEMVSKNSVDIAKNMGFNEQELQQIKLAGLMHDIGKIGIDEIVLNTQGKLTDENWKAVRRHPEIGYKILKSSYEFSEIASFVLEHHERCDGKGYPRGLKGEEISLQTRIIAVAEFFDVMISKRSYKKKLHIDDAISEIQKCAGKQLDPEVVRVFIENVLVKKQN